MKRYFISCLVVILLLSGLVFPGCGGGSGGNKIKNQIKVYETSGGFAYMSTELNQSGIVFADSFNEIGEEYILYVPNLAGSITSSIQAIAYDEQGNIKDSPIILEKNPLESNCFSLDIIDIINGKISADIIANAPGGYCELNVVCGELSRIVKVWVYDSYGNLPGSNGIRIESNGQKSTPNGNENECTFFNYGSEIRLVSEIYYVDTCNINTWQEKFKTVQECQISLVSDNNESNKILINEWGTTYKIYVAKVPNTANGFVKILAIDSRTIIWEYSNRIEEGKIKFY